MQDLISVYQGVAEEILKTRSGSRDLATEMLMSKLGADLQRAVDRFTHEGIESTWSKFDVNRDGFLQESEIHEVVKSLLTDIKENMPLMIQRAMEPAAQNLQEWIESDAFGPIGMGGTRSGVQTVLERNVQERIGRASEKLSGVLGAMLGKLVSSSKPIAAEIFATVDVNKDGKVSKAEFYECFADAFDQVIDFGKIAQTMILRRSASTLVANTSSDSVTIFGSAIIMLAVASVVFILWKRKP